ncbi:MAG: hypothetical protein ABH824_01675 [Nanoarchaeota archaeon]
MIRKIMLLLFLLLLITGCAQEHPFANRHDKIPTDLEKMTPELDKHPPILHSDEFENPVPLAIINTAGGEDSPFIPADRDEFYFFFTPDVRVPVEKQILDGVTGIWMSKMENGGFTEPQRVWLQKPGKLSGDGCEFVQDNEMIFCTVREGYTGVHWFSAEWKDNKWTKWKNADFNPEYDVGELHIWNDELYYHSDREGGKSGTDIWMLKRIDGEWKNPVNIEAVNSEEIEGWPYVTADGNEMWFNRRYLGTPATFRSKRINGEWQKPELIVSQFAGEPTLDKNGNLYFVHHYYDNGVMLEADIYVAYRK